MESNKIEAKIKAVNTVHAKVNELYPILLERFRPLVGQKILKIDLCLLAKYADLAKLPDMGDIKEIRRHNTYALQWNIYSNVFYQEFTHERHNVDIYIGKIENLCLVNLNEDLPKLRTDYTLDEVKQFQSVINNAKKQYESIRNTFRTELNLFGEFAY